MGEERGNGEALKLTMKVLGVGIDGMKGKKGKKRMDKK